MTILVCGGRDYDDQARVTAALSEFAMTGPHVVVHGAARGADTLASFAAFALGWEVRGYPANWKRDGKAAGPIRNAEMLARERVDLVLAFPGGAGTYDMVKKARKAGVLVRRIRPAS